MSFLFGKPELPEQTPALPQPAGETNLTNELRKRAAASGRRSTILTSPTGLQPSDNKKKTLLGE